MLGFCCFHFRGMYERMIIIYIYVYILNTWANKSLIKFLRFFLGFISVYTCFLTKSCIPADTMLLECTLMRHFIISLMVYCCFSLQWIFGGFILSSYLFGEWWQDKALKWRTLGRLGHPRWALLLGVHVASN
jgi:hypothetical protein